jgi:putative transcriptional regulator
MKPSASSHANKPATRSASARFSSTGMKSRVRRGAAPESSIGQKLIEGLTSMRDTLATGQGLEKRFTVRSVRAPLEPKAWTPQEIKRLRERLGASQGVFAQLLGASARTVQAWEQNQVAPAAMARRLLECIERDEAHWQSLLHASRIDKKAS